MTNILMMSTNYVQKNHYDQSNNDIVFVTFQFQPSLLNDIVLDWSGECNLVDIYVY